MECSAFKWVVFNKVEDIESLQKSRKAVKRLGYDEVAHDEVINAAIADLKNTVDEWVNQLLTKEQQVARSRETDQD